MKNRFVLPVCFAAAAHGALLFGFSKNSRSASSPAKDVTLVVPFVVPPLSEEVVVLDHQVCGGAPKAVPDAPPIPRTEEPLLPFLDGGATMPTPPRLPPVSTTDIRAISDDTFGKPGGIGTSNWGDVFSHTLLDDSPRTRSQSAPFYPAEAKRNGLGGTVTVEFLVDERGHVLEPRVVNSSDRVFEEPSLRAVAKWRFEPGRREGRVVRFRMAVPLVFNLNE